MDTYMEENIIKMNKKKHAKTTMPKKEVKKNVQFQLCCVVVRLSIIYDKKKNIGETKAYPGRLINYELFFNRYFYYSC